MEHYTSKIECGYFTNHNRKELPADLKKGTENITTAINSSKVIERSWREHLNLHLALWTALLVLYLLLKTFL